MSFIIACFEMEDTSGLKSRRFDLVRQYGRYIPLEATAPKGKPFKCYLRNDHTNFRGDRRRLSDLSLTSGKKSITSIFTPDANHPLKGYGDVKGTMDALLVEFTPDYKKMTIYVARGCARNCVALFTRFVNGSLSDDIAELRNGQ